MDKFSMICIGGMLLFSLLMEGLGLLLAKYQDQLNDRNRQSKEAIKKHIRNYPKGLQYENPYLQWFQNALEREDVDGMLRALQQNKAHCHGANAQCLHSRICIDCPMGGVLMTNVPNDE